MSVNLATLCGAVCGQWGGQPNGWQKAARGTVPYIERAGFVFVDGVGQTDHCCIVEPFGEKGKVSNGLFLCFAGDESLDAVRITKALDGKGITIVTGLKTVDEALEAIAECYGERAQPALDKRKADLSAMVPIEPKRKRRFAYR